MADIHLTREILRAAFRGELPARILVQIGLQHLMGVLQRERTAGAPDDYSRTFEPPSGPPPGGGAPAGTRAAAGRT